MNKGELVTAMSKKSDLSKKATATALDALVEVLVAEIAHGEKVQLIGFGTFEAKKRPSRMARNPRTGDPVRIQPYMAATFKPGKLLKLAINHKLPKRK